MKSSTKYAIITFLITGALLGGPKACTLYTQKKEGLRHKKLAQERIWTEQNAKYEEHVKDSVLYANGFNKDDCFSCQTTDLERQIAELSWQNSAGGALEKAVFSAGEQIIKHNIDIIVMELAKYGLEINSVIEITNDMCKNPEVIMYGAYQDANIEDRYSAHDYFVSQIVKNIDFAALSEIQDQDIVQLVDTCFSTMLSELYTSRKTIEKSFAPYFAGGQECLDNNAAFHDGEGASYAGYDRDNICRPYRITQRNVKVYDSALPVDFFGDKNTVYKLVQVSKGQWRVSKQSNNGKMSRTPVFVHNTDYDTCVYMGKEKQKNTFSFYPGKNMGVHVSTSEVIRIQKAKKHYKKNPIINKQIDSLSLRRDSLNKREREYIYTLAHADSVARLKLKQRVAARTYSK